MRGSRPPCPQATTPLPCPVPCAGQPRARLWSQTLDLPDERRWWGPWGAGQGCREHPALLSTVGQAGADRRNRLSLSSPSIPPVTGGLWQEEGWSQAPSTPLSLIPGSCTTSLEPLGAKPDRMCALNAAPSRGREQDGERKGGLRLLEFSRRGSSRKTLEIGWALASTLICLFLSRLNPSRVVSGTMLLLGLLPEGKSNPFKENLYTKCFQTLFRTCGAGVCTRLSLLLPHSY